MRLQSEEEGTIKEICYRLFERGFSIDEVIKKRKYKRQTVVEYKSKHRNEHLHGLGYTSCMYNSRKREYSSEEMDYGSTLPTYKFEDLSWGERHLTKKEEHRHLKQINYEQIRLQHDS